jgi:hypothetical protein
LTGGGSCLYDAANEKRERRSEKEPEAATKKINRKGYQVRNIYTAIRRHAADLDRPPNFTEDRTRGGEEAHQQENISQM